MSVDMDELLREASGEPEALIDADELWTRGRRKRWVRLAGSSAAGLTAVAVVAVAAVGLTGGSNVPIIEPIGQEDGAPADTATDDEATDSTDATGVEDPGTTDGSVVDPEVLRDEVLAIEQRLQAEQERVQALVEQAERDRMAAKTAAEEARAAAEAAATSEPGPEPDSARMADPCQVHEGGPMSVFIDVVSPVGSQEVGTQVELVGCSSVYEGTILFRVLGQDGNVVVEGLTTATAGGPEIGEFRESIELPGAGDYDLEVFWEDAADGSERDLVSIPFTR